MRILHYSGVEDDTDTLQRVVDFAIQEDIDAMVSSGDHLNPSACLTPDEMERMNVAAQFIIDNTNFRVRIPPFKEVIKLLIESNREDLSELIKAAKVYNPLAAKFGENARRQYSGQRRILELFPRQENVLFVPGLNDTEESLDELSNYCLHRSVRTIDGIEFGGFGGSRARGAIPRGSVTDDPATLTEPIGKVAARFLCEKQPDIIVTNVLPWNLQDTGYFGKDKQLANIGDPHLYAALANAGADLWLAGSTRYGIGCTRENAFREAGTYVNNPGSIARNSQSGRAGTFTVIELEQNGGRFDGNMVLSVQPYIIREETIEPGDNYGSRPELDLAARKPSQATVKKND